MKKSLTSILAASLLAVTFVGCGDGPNPSEEEADFRCRKGGVLAPKWVCKPQLGYEGLEYTDLGSAEPGTLGDSFTRREALAVARTNLAFQMETKVKAKITDWARQTGAGAGQVGDKVVEQVAKQTAEQTLSGSKQIDSWNHPQTDTLYVLVGMSENTVNAAVKRNVKTSYKNDEALWQQFQAKNALESLEKEFPTK